MFGDKVVAGVVHPPPSISDIKYPSVNGCKVIDHPNAQVARLEDEVIASPESSHSSDSSDPLLNVQHSPPWHSPVLQQVHLRKSGVYNHPCRLP